ncbi:hypothetical protein EJ357_20330 [Streptomyces cyaneochromogenes]|uniref:Uncharacterized protein n=1 Tax=Streptomyces cyaneochromogenes TaxID=2496836 RepID=A0A3Q9ETL1_9ACTN|nr:hypothetical protein [Streptomyces cyaneochromogenes]AZQ35555.1 hypothetical protein EJ357_20330 [Streptomyces cyaneochromogenes]
MPTPVLVVALEPTTHAQRRTLVEELLKVSGRWGHARRKPAQGLTPTAIEAIAGQSAAYGSPTPHA